MVINCPVCGKLMCIHWPEHWIHRRGATYYCSDNCLQVDLVKDTKLLNQSMKRRKGKVKAILNEEQRQHAIQIALSGGDPRPFLTDCGSKCPEKLWGSIKASVRENDPETFKKLPAKIRWAKPGPKPKTAGDAMNAMQEAADHFFGECDRLLGKDESEQIETPEAPKRRNHTLLRNSNYTVSAIRTDLGEFYYDKKFDRLDWRTIEGEEISMSPAAWFRLYEMIPEVMGILEVETDRVEE